MSRALVLGCLLSAAVAGAAPVRMALAVGSNQGAPSRPVLWFAERDAERMAGTLRELGGFEPAQVQVLKGPTAAELEQALSALGERARAALARGEDPLVVFYYSGHADPQGLELGRERLAYGELSRLLTGIPEGVRIAILDACHSGALTQVKGARPAPLDFEVPTQGRADGIAFITSSSATEAAQESASLGGSFFTHHLTLGLRGAADADGDGRVTLTESYRYAYHRTLAATAEAGVAPQHPTYAIRMAGKGEVVLVDLRKARSALAFAAGVGRGYLVTHLESEEVVAEVSSAAEPLRIALPPGRYRVERIYPAPRLTGVVDLPDEGIAAVDDGQLASVVAVAARSKGEQPRVDHTYAFGELWVATAVLRNFGPGYGVGAGVRRDLTPHTVWASVAYAQKPVEDDGLSYRFRAVTLSAGAARRFTWGGVEPFAGFSFGVSFAEQSLPDGRLTGGVVLQAGPNLGFAVPLKEWMTLRVGLTPLLHSFQLNGAQVLRGSVQMASGVDFAL